LRDLAFRLSSRYPFSNTPRPPYTDLINKPVPDAINKQILKLSTRPEFVVFGGDMAYRGCYDGTYTFQAWNDVMAPLMKAGIKLYTAFGNHELFLHDHDTPEKGFFKENQQEFPKVFSENPGNGPPGYERLVYSFTSPGGDAFFAVLDPYYLAPHAPDPYVPLTWAAPSIPSN
jgi:hypothetical protein